MCTSYPTIWGGNTANATAADACIDWCYGAAMRYVQSGCYLLLINRTRVAAAVTLKEQLVHLNIANVVHVYNRGKKREHQLMFAL